MLNAETKRKIQGLRDTLVGKIPVPTDQVKQITLGLIYKFMSDIDKENTDILGGKSFFNGDYGRYSWNNIIDKSLSSYERVTLYSEGLEKMSLNPNIPELFRDIFKNAYLPFRDPATLSQFLIGINEFNYDHSEDLGDAFEFLLSVMASQGDAGQFRTPRHIIDFIVKVVEPKKTDRILDPACGTAGFLISAYKYILKNNKISDSDRPGSALSLTEKNKLTENFVGYDISTDMVRLSLVNMYLHNFANPNIKEYDTLTSEELWDEDFDCIMANPPFMTPKGGIRPHKRFAIRANRSELLFVDYIAEHLMPNGKAGVIVPEGIIFQSSNAYKALRKMLIDDSYLYAVVSLPAGVFQPYSGVKTSILFVDKTIASKTNNILFVKIENDGFDLGAQRREIDKNDLSEALEIILNYKKSILSNRELKEGNKSISIIVSKEKIGESGDYNLTGERYKEILTSLSEQWPLVEIGKVADIFNGITSPRSSYASQGKVKVIKVKDYDEYNIYFDKDEKGWINDAIITDKYLKKGDILIINAAHNASHVGKKIGYCSQEPPIKSLPSGEVMIIRSNEKVDSLLLKYLVKSEVFRAKIRKLVKGIHLYPKDVKFIKIPMLPKDAQHKIVKELNEYQKIIDGARQVVENYKPKIEIDPEWENVKLREVADVLNGRAYKQEELLSSGKYPVLRVGNFFSNRDWYYSDLELQEDKYCVNGDLLYAWSASFGPRIWKGGKSIYHYHIWKIKTGSRLDKNFLFYFLEKETENIKSEGGRGIAMIHITKSNFEKIEIPLPPLKIQKQIVEKVEFERTLVESSKKLIELFEQKIKDKINSIWEK